MVGDDETVNRVQAQLARTYANAASQESVVLSAIGRLACRRLADGGSATIADLIALARADIEDTPSVVGRTAVELDLERQRLEAVIRHLERLAAS